ncbi:hypothetical protein C4K46_09970 [Streptococcus oricebi]|uniref:Uncharacterized protein n=2 Tax=Streptococcus oricebi TaxID=1547447 RepID=A0ABS5B607_9STRE|nr:hypothetical protein [Streptococcus oricebi]
MVLVPLRQLYQYITYLVPCQYFLTPFFTFFEIIKKRAEFAKSTSIGFLGKLRTLYLFFKK